MYTHTTIHTCKHTHIYTRLKIKTNLSLKEKKGFVLAYGLRVQFIMAGKAWWLSHYAHSEGAERNKCWYTISLSLHKCLKGKCSGLNENAPTDQACGYLVLFGDLEVWPCWRKISLVCVLGGGGVWGIHRLSIELVVSCPAGDMSSQRFLLPMTGACWPVSLLWWWWTLIPLELQAPNKPSVSFLSQGVCHSNRKRTKIKPSVPNGHRVKPVTLWTKTNLVSLHNNYLKYSVAMTESDENNIKYLLEQPK